HGDERLIYVNGACRRLLGIDVTRERWDAVDLNQWIHPDDRAAMRDLYRKVHTVDTQIVSHVVEVRLRAADGNWRICEVSAVLVGVGGAAGDLCGGRGGPPRQAEAAQA